MTRIASEGTAPRRKRQQHRKDIPMTTTEPNISRQQHLIQQMNKASNVQPPIVYGALGLLCGGFWALGTSVQVLTSEAWITHQSLSTIGFTAFGQLADAVSGKLAPDMWIPFTFGWGVQIALIVAAVGVELPKRPAWRWWLAVGSQFWSHHRQFLWGLCEFHPVRLLGTTWLYHRHLLLNLCHDAFCHHGFQTCLCPGKVASGA